MYKFYLQNLARLLMHRRARKFLLFMKLITLLLFTFIMHVSASSLAQKVTLIEKNAPLEDVFDRISNQTGYDFIFTESDLQFAKTITISVKNEALSDVLTKIFAGQPLDFTIENKSVVIREKKISAAESTAKPTQTDMTITGVIVDDHGMPMPGVTIKIKGTNFVWTTNHKGIFVAVFNVPNAVLQFSFIGYLTQEIPAIQLKNPVYITLKEDMSKLNEVQIIGYGTTTKRANTGDVTTIDAKTISQYPTTNALDVLQGTVPGLVISKQSGNTPGTYTVAIRGRNGLKASPPYYVIDGVPYQGGGWISNNYIGVSGGAGSITSQAGIAYDAMSMINPDDIESITVLKDADATAIYGSRGADGVILITTKKGKSGKTRIDASVYSGVSDIARHVQLLNQQQYLQMRHEAFKNDGLPFPSLATNPKDVNYDVNGAWDTTRSTNWQKALIGGFGHKTNAQIGISGGNDQVQYRISGGYNYDSNLMHLGGNNQSANVNLNLTSTTKDKKFTMSFTGGYLYSINTQAGADLTLDAMQLAPDAPALYNPDGTLNFQNNTFVNPLTQRNFQINTPQDNLTSSLTLSYKPVNNLEIIVTSGYNKQNEQEFYGTPSTAFPPYQLSIPSSQFLYQSRYNWTATPQINYNNQISKGKLAVTLGANVQNMNSTRMGLNVSGYSTDLLLSSPTAGSSINVLYPYNVATTRNAAWFGRINYNWADKYYIDFTGRRDGSSNFGQNKQFHLFAGVGAGWIFSEESLIKNNLPFLSFGKLRGSYGGTGRDITDPYLYLTSYRTTNIAVPYGGVVGLTPTGLPNPDLSWESTTKAELGLELQFLQGRIALETNFYRNRTTGLLTPNTLSIVTGFSSITQNLPATTQSKGFDVSLTTTNIRNKSLSWSTTVIFTRDRSTLLSYPNLATSSYSNQYIIGQPVNIIKTFRFGGVNPQTGIYQLIGADGNLIAPQDANPIKDANALVNINPNFYGSVQNNFTYKGFGLSFLFRFMKQNGQNLFYYVANGVPGDAANYPTLVLQRWQKPGDITNIQRYANINFANFPLVLFGGRVAQSNAGYSDASYIRLQNVSFSYTVPSKAVQRFGVQNLQVFVQGDNLLTITGYKGLDPETQSLATLPPLRIITAGLKLTL